MGYMNMQNICHNVPSGKILQPASEGKKKQKLPSRGIVGCTSGTCSACICQCTIWCFSLEKKPVVHLLMQNLNSSSAC